MILLRYLYLSTCSISLWLKLTQNCGCLPKYITFDLASFTIIWLLAQNVYRPFNCLCKPFGVSENRIRSSAHNKCTNIVFEIHTPTLQSKYCFKSDMYFWKRKPLATPPWLTPMSLWIIGLSLELRFTRKSVFVYKFLRVTTTRPFHIPLLSLMVFSSKSKYLLRVSLPVLLIAALSTLCAVFMDKSGWRSLNRFHHVKLGPVSFKHLCSSGRCKSIDQA